MIRRRKAFTLIELLVVIAIIAILAAILFPVFAQAREKAKSAACLNNMKQLGLAFQQYLTDSDGGYPLTGWGDRSPNGYQFGDAVWVLSGYRPGDTNRQLPAPSKACFYWYDCEYLGEPRLGVLWPYTKNDDIYRCPSVGQRVSRRNGINQLCQTDCIFDGAKAKVTYAMNDKFMVEMKKAIREPRVTFPSSTFLLLDETAYTLNDSNFSAGNPDSFGLQHSDGGAILLADGHVKRYAVKDIYRYDTRTGSAAAGRFAYRVEPTRTNQ